MMNLDQLQKRLQDPSVTDQHLIHYVQNPNGQVPSVLALAELKRRQEVRSSITPQQQAQNVMQPTVADKVISQDVQANIGPNYTQQGLGTVAPQRQAQNMLQQGVTSLPQRMASGGLTDLPISDSMYDEKNFAGGGIVAFDEGGDVRHYAKGDYVLPPGYDPIAYYAALKEKMAGIPQFVPGETIPGQKYKEQMSKLKQTAESPYDPAIRYYEGLGMGGKQYYGPIPSGLTPVGILQKERSKFLSGEPSSMDLSKPAADAAKQSDAISEALKKAGANKNMPKFGEKDAAKGSKGSGYYDLEKVPTIGEGAKEFEDYMGPRGDQEKRKARLERVEKRADYLEKMAPGMSMLEAGLAIYGGTSPFANENIKAGAVGLQRYQAYQDKVDALRDKRDEIADAYDEADYRQKLAAAEYGGRSKQAIQENNRKTVLQREHLNTLKEIASLDREAKLSLGGAKGALNANQRATLKLKILNGEDPIFEQKKNELIAIKGPKVVNTPEWKTWVDQYVDHRLDQLTAGSSAIAFEGYEENQ